MSLMSAGREERLKAVEKLYRIRLTWTEKGKKNRSFMDIKRRAPEKFGCRTLEVVGCVHINECTYCGPLWIKVAAKEMLYKCNSM